MAAGRGVSARGPVSRPRLEPPLLAQQFQPVAMSRVTSGFGTGDATGVKGLVSLYLAPGNQNMSSSRYPHQTVITEPSTNTEMNTVIQAYNED